MKSPRTSPAPAVEELPGIGSMLLEGIEADCVICGCSDLRACRGRCRWAFVDREQGLGICTNCIAPINGKKVKLAKNLALRVVQEGIADKAHLSRLTAFFGSAMMLFRDKAPVKAKLHAKGARR